MKPKAGSLINKIAKSPTDGSGKKERRHNY